MLSYYIFRFFVFLFSLMPFWLFYRLCDVLYFLLYRVFKYRYQVIKTNLENSFPEKTEQEIKVIIQQCYRNLGDIFLEGIKGLTMSNETVLKRYKFLNHHIMFKYLDNGQSIFCAPAHYGNWEWATNAFTLFMDCEVGALYKPLRNKYIDQYVREGREKTGMVMKSIKETRQLLDEFEGKPTIFAFIADQTPSNLKKADWLTFLNQDTPCLHGLDRHARRTGFPVFFAYPKRIGRGYYEITFEEIVPDPKATKEGEITALFMAKLEELIKREPANWLWSHKRWKRKRSELEEL